MTHPTGDEPAPPDPDRVDPAVLVALLRRHGWQRRGGASGRYSRWTPPDSDGTSLLVPEAAPPGGPSSPGPPDRRRTHGRGSAPGPAGAHRGYADYADLLGEALTALTHSPAPSAREILHALTVPGDEIRWRRAVPRIGGAVSWAAAEHLRSAAGAMLSAAARAALRPAGYFGGRQGPQAAALLEQVLVGAAPGGHVLTAYTPVPDCRPVATTLMRALQATRDAVDYERATGAPDAFDAAVALGVSHELARALIKLVRGTEGVTVALAWSPSAGPPDGLAARPEAVGFTPGDLPALAAAGDRYREREPSVEVRLTGTVVRLRRPAPAGGGTVRLRVLAGADVRQVRIGLDEESYRIAVHAHLLGLPLRVSGRLDSHGGFRRLHGAGAVAPVQVDEAERDRLLKSLQDGPDTFEDACGGDQA